MKKILTTKEINDFKVNGAIILRKKFEINWIEILKIGIKKDIKSPSPRFKSHTVQKNIPAMNLYKKNGFVLKKSLKKNFVKNGQSWKLVEWEMKNPNIEKKLDE